MSGLPRAGALLAAWLSCSCGAARLTLPTGAGVPASDAVEAFGQAIQVCRAITSLSAEIAVSGRSNGQRIRGRVLAGLAAPSSALLDAAAPFGASVFIYAARDGEVTLLLPRDRRVLRSASPAAVLEAVTGLSMEASDLRRMLTGCPPDEAPIRGRAFGSSWRAVELARGDAFLYRSSESAPWVLVAVTEHRPVDLRVDFREFRDGLPASIALSSKDGQLNLRLGLSQVEVNPDLGPEVFTVRVPENAEPLSLEELRRNGPLGERAGE